MARGPNFLKRLKANWDCLKQGKSGSRFIDCYVYKQGLRDRYGPIYQRVDVSLGVATVAFGLFMVPAPGPGWIIVFTGLALLAGESKKVARFMDKSEVFLRGAKVKTIRSWRRASFFVKSSLTLSAGAIASAIAYGVYCFVAG